MHVGTARTALFNWLYARHTGGTFIVRIDDTDEDRNEPRFEADILEGLRWLGLEWDEGVETGGPHGSYRQSDRYSRYAAAAEELVLAGKAYPCFCTPGELEERRREAEAAGRPPGYDGRCRNIDPAGAAARREAGEAAAIRFAMSRPGQTVFTDLIRGEITVDHDHVDDFVLLRSDGRPTYHLASTVDDVDYEISHVARGEDLLPSTPRHIRLTLALGGSVPTYAHIPLIHGPDGKRLSKRHGARGVTEYRDAGYLPDAIINYLSLLGWSPGGDVTIFSMADSIARFDLADVQKNPAVFDQAKLDWMNGEYIRALPVGEFMRRAHPYLEDGLGKSLRPEEWERFEAMAGLVQERTRLLAEVADQVRFLFEDDLQPTPEAAKLLSDPATASLLAAVVTALADVVDWNHEQLETTLRGLLENLGLSARKGLQPIRAAVTGSLVSPPLFESMAVLGRDATLTRLKAVAARPG